MSKYGSGNWLRWNNKATIEDLLRVDIRYLKKKGYLNPYEFGTLGWSSGGELSGRINFFTSVNTIHLNYRIKIGQDDWQHISQLIQFDRTECNFGGERLWFICPECKRRVGLLCCSHILFLCRHCCHVSYSSNQNGYVKNLINQKYKLGYRIFASYEFGSGRGKKKGMHWKTFDRLYSRYIALDRKWQNYLDSVDN